MKIRYLLFILAVPVLLWAFVRAMDSVANMPVVYESYSAGECVKVEGAGSCENLPDRYIHQWMQ